MTGWPYSGEPVWNIWDDLELLLREKHLIDFYRNKKLGRRKVKDGWKGQYIRATKDAKNTVRKQIIGIAKGKRSQKWSSKPLRTVGSEKSSPPAVNEIPEKEKDDLT